MKTFTFRFLLPFVLFISLQAHSQVKIGDNATSVNPNALLELESSSKGLLLPRLTNNQIQAMTNVPVGMLLFSTTDSALYLKRDTGWAILGFKTKPVVSTWAENSSGDIYNTNFGKVGIGTDKPYSLLSNTPDNVLDKEGYGGNEYGSFNWQSNGYGYAGMISNFGDGRGLLVRTAQGNGNALEVDGGDHNLLNVLATGNVGIGTGTPSAKLDVNGSMKVSGNMNVSGNIEIGGNVKVDKLDVGLIDSVTNATLYAGQFKAFYAGCPTGYKLLGGGGGHRDFNYYQKEMVVNYSGPDPLNTNRWRVLMTNLTKTDYLQVQVYAICGKVK